MNYQKYGGRRFLLALGAGLVTSLLQWYGKLDPAGTAYAATVAATVAAYFTCNVVESKNSSAAALDSKSNI